MQIVLYKEKLRRIVNVDYNTSSDLIASYKGFEIRLNEQETGGWYAKVIGPKGQFCVDGYYPEIETKEDMLRRCFENMELVHSDHSSTKLF